MIQCVTCWTQVAGHMLVRAGARLFHRLQLLMCHICHSDSLLVDD
jgi:hypothetical protein